jgi:hypothetical protein
MDLGKIVRIVVIPERREGAPIPAPNWPRRERPQPEGPFAPYPVPLPNPERTRKEAER